jgi:hypothetical protein
MKYNLAYFLVWIYRFLFKKGTYKHYELTFLMEDINEEKGVELTTNLMKKNKACTPWL